MRKFIAALLIVLFLPCAFLFQGVSAVNGWLFNPDFYKSLIDDPDIYNAFLIDSGLIQYFDFTAELQTVSPALAQMMAAAAPSPQEWQRIATSLVDEMFRVLDGQQEFITLEVDLSGFGDMLSSDTGVTYLRGYGESLAACAPGQNPYVTDGISTRLPLPSCLPPGEDADTFTDNLVENRLAIAAQFETPIEYVIPTGSTTETNGIATGFSALRGGMQGWQTTMGLLALVFGALAVLLIAKTGRGRLRWFGIILLPPSLFMLLIGTTLVGGLTASLSGVMGGSIVLEGNFGVAIANSLTNGIARAVGTFVQSGLLFTVIAVACILLGVGLDRFRPRYVTEAAGAAAEKAKRVSESAVTATGKTRDYVSQRAEEMNLNERAENVRRTAADLSTQARTKANDFLQSENTQQTLKRGQETADAALRGALNFGKRLSDQLNNPTTPAAANSQPTGNGSVGGASTPAETPPPADEAASSPTDDSGDDQPKP